MSTLIKVARYRNSPYIVNYKSNGENKKYTWSGSKASKIDIKEIPEEVVNHLLMSSRCFTDGELKIIEDSPISTELVENIDNVENYKDNTHTRDEIIKILNGNTNSMKTTLAKITVATEKSFIIDIAKSIDIDSSVKREFLAKWMGIPSDILFSTDD